MFNNLVESDSHREDYRRKAAFFIYTLAGYAVLMLVTGVASIYAYEAHLENQNLEFLTLVAPPAQQPPSVQRNEPPRAKAEASDVNQLPERDQLIARVGDSTRTPDRISAVGSTTPEMPTNDFALTGRNSEGGSLGNQHGPLTPGYGNSTGNGSNGNLVKIEDTDKPPLLKVEPPPAPKRQLVNKGVINSQAINLPKPSYPQIARLARASGTVTVQILLDETGKVISARVLSGHPLLQDAAVKAAYQARFSPTILSGEPVKVSGMITYNFVPQ